MFYKKSCQKVLTKKSAKNPKSIFPNFFSHVFGCFSVRGVQKHDVVNLALFWPLTHPPAMGVTDFFCRPLLAAGKWETPTADRRPQTAGGGSSGVFRCLGLGGWNRCIWWSDGRWPLNGVGRYFFFFLIYF
jgi:hypothetical protein